jgi:hypothetical protein
LGGSWFGTAEAGPFPDKVKIKVNGSGNIKVKGDGQECPSHTFELLP